MPFRTPHAAPLFAAALLLAGCWGGEGDSGSLVDTYAPKYTEPAGTVHDGDFFPLVPGDIYSIRGITETDLRMTLRGSSQGQPVSQDSSSTTIDTVEGTVETLEPRELAVSRGTFTVYPQASLLSGSGESQVATSYYEKTAEAIHLRGHQGGESEPVAEPDPSLFLKLPLRVGDSWDAASTEGPEAAEELDLQMASRSRIFVVGMEGVVVGGRSVQALRLDRVQEVTGTGVQGGVSMTLAAEFTTAAYLVEGEGQVLERITGRVSVKGSNSQDGNSVKVSLTLDMEGEMMKVPLQLLPGAKRDSRGPSAAAPRPARLDAAVPAPGIPALPSAEARAAAAVRRLAVGIARARYRLPATLSTR